MIKIYFNKLENGNLEITENMLNDILSYMKRQEKEIERLNNIINKIKECLSKNRVYISGERNLAFELDDILKGVDKE